MKGTREDIDRAPALGCRIGRAYQIMLSQLAAALKEADLDITTSEYLVLRAVYSSPGLQQCEIAEMVGKDKAAICRCVAGLEKKDMVSTVTVSHKCLKVYPTSKARDIEPAIMDVATKRHQALMDLTTPENLAIFSEIIDKIIKENR